MLNFTKMQQSNFKACVRDSTNKIHHISNLFSNGDRLFYLAKNSIEFLKTRFTPHTVVFHGILNEISAYFAMKTICS